jgi:hypothetical protein
LIAHYTIAALLSWEKKAKLKESNNCFDPKKNEQED